MQNKIQKAKLNIMLRDPFFATILLNLQISQDNAKTETAATDGKAIYYNINFFNKLNDKEMQFILIHEILHLCFYHHTRRQDRNPKLWNIASDYVINYYAQQAGYTLPEGTLIDYRYKGLTTEQLYNLLNKQQQQQKKQEEQQEQQQQEQNQDKNQSGSNGSKEENQEQENNEPETENNNTDGTENADTEEETENETDTSEASEEETTEEAKPEKTKAEQMREAGEVLDAAKDEAGTKEAETETETLLKQAAINALKVGKGNELTERILKAGQKKRNFSELIREHIQPAKNDYNFSKPNRRYYNNSFILPSLKSEEKKPLAIAIDTSGSLNFETLTEFWNEIYFLIQENKLDTQIILYTHEIYYNEKFTYSDTPKKIENVCSGGTHTQAVFELLENQEDETPELLINFTDLKDNFYFLKNKTYNFNYLFVSTGRNEDYYISPEKIIMFD